MAALCGRIGRILAKAGSGAMLLLRRVEYSVRLQQCLEVFLETVGTWMTFG